MKTNKQQQEPDVLLKICAQEESIALIDQAAEILGKSRQDFIIEACCKAAESTLAQS